VPQSRPNCCDIVQFQKISILPSQKGLEFLGGGGFCKTKKCKEMYEVQSEFPEGWGDLEKFPSMGEVWIFSGTKHLKTDRLSVKLLILRKNHFLFAEKQL